MSKAFDQSRKNTAATVEESVQELLADHFDVPTPRVVSAESEINNRYDTSNITATHLLDFACVDWLVDVRPSITPIAQRITPKKGSARFSIRTDNGSNMPCEADVLPTNGLTPTHYIFGWRIGNTLTRAWLLDADQAYQTVVDSPHTDHITNEDGTAAMYLDIGELARAGCIITGFEL